MVKKRFKILASLGDWRCVCSAGWDGDDCSTRLETNCADGIDNDGGEKKKYFFVCLVLFVNVWDSGLTLGLAMIGFLLVLFVSS